MKGLVLEGGASRGAYIIGAYRALEEAGLSFDAITGTSIGAINGAMIAQGSAQEAWELWNSLEFRTVFDMNESVVEYLTFDRNLQSIPLWIQNGLRIVHDRGFDITPLRRLLRERIDEDRLRKAGVHFGLTTINLSKRRIEQPFWMKCQKAPCTTISWPRPIWRVFVPNPCLATIIWTGPIMTIFPGAC